MSLAAALLLGEPQLPESFSEGWDAQIHSGEDGLEGALPTAVRGPDKHEHALFCNGSPHYRYKNLTLAPDKTNGSAEHTEYYKTLLSCWQFFQR